MISNNRLTSNPEVSERGRALIAAAAILDNPDYDLDSDTVVIARQLTRAQEEIEELTAKLLIAKSDLKHLRVISP